jgi:ABC-type lipoprotein release transport system permease subunit
MRGLLGVAGTGLSAALLHPLRSFVTVACLVAVLLPYLVGVGISRGVQKDAEDAVRYGADLYVTGSQFGRDVPVPVGAADAVGRIDGVRDVVPRIVGRVVLGREGEEAVLVGLPPDRFPAGVECVEGRLPQSGGVNELVVGSEIAHRLSLTVGDFVPPFYRNRQGERLSRVVGVFRSDVALWQARLVFTTFDTAARIFDQRGVATDLLVYCRPGYADEVRRAVQQSVRLSPPDADAPVRPRVTSREDLEALLPRGLSHREGVFSLLFVLAFAVGILVVLVTSGFGLSGRRREIGILKATGWQTDEVLLRSGVEGLALTLVGASVSVLLAYVWLEWLNGRWVAGVFLVGVGAEPSFKVPFRLTPVPVLLAFLVGFVVVMGGTLYSSWRAATAAPFEAIRAAR